MLVDYWIAGVSFGSSRKSFRWHSGICTEHGEEVGCAMAKGYVTRQEAEVAAINLSNQVGSVFYRGEPCVMQMQADVWDAT